MKDRERDLRIVEHVSSVWSYHVAEEGSIVALCGKDMMMGTHMSIETWGRRGGNLPARWCRKCGAALAATTEGG